MPADGAVGGLGADQVAVGPKRIEHLAFDGRRGAGGGIIRNLIGFADLAQVRGPDSFAVGDGDRLHKFIIQPFVAEQVEPFRNRGRRGVAGPDVLDLPQELGSLLRPFGEEAGFLRDSAAARPSELRPVFAKGRALAEGDDHDQTTRHG